MTWRAGSVDLGALTDDRMPATTSPPGARAEIAKLHLDSTERARLIIRKRTSFGCRLPGSHGVCGLVMPAVLSARQWIQPGLIFVSGHPGSPIVRRPGERHGLHAAALAAQR